MKKFYTRLNKRQRGLLTLPLLLGKMIDTGEFRKVREKLPNTHYSTSSFIPSIFFKNITTVINISNFKNIKIGDK